MTTKTTLDPIGDKYFAPLRVADQASDLLFITTAVLSFAALMVDKNDQPNTYNFVQTAFIICVVGLFVVGQAIRLYLWPRAEDRRREEFLSNTLSVSLTHERTSGYYNNSETDPIRRMGVAVLENTHFTMNIALEMARNERFRITAYGLGWLLMVLNRETDLGWIAVAAQAVFSEQLVSRWLRIEWLRIKAEEIHFALAKVFNSAPSPEMLRAYVLDAFGTYETTKANGGVVLSTTIFMRRNNELSKEWDEKKKSMNL